MPQSKGHTGNPNGRPKGVPNKTTKQTRDWLSKIIAKNRKQMEQDLAALEPKDRLLVLEKFMQYTTPKMQSVSAAVSLEQLTEPQLDQIIGTLTANLETE